MEWGSGGGGFMGWQRESHRTHRMQDFHNLRYFVNNCLLITRFVISKCRRV